MTRDDHVVIDGRADALGALGRDASRAIRGLARRPLFSAIVILTLALGIGANTAIFSVVDAVLLRPLPTPQLDRLVVVHDELPGIPLEKAQMSPAEVRDLFARTDLFQLATAYAGGTFTLTGMGDARRVASVATMGRFFDVFGVRPFLGRVYRADESEPGKDKVAVLSYAFWQELTGGDRGIIGRPLGLSGESGRAIELDGERFLVIGVLPPEFRFPRTAQIYTPMALRPQLFNGRGSLYMNFVARLAPGISHETVAARLRDQAAQWVRAGMYDPKYRYTLSTEPLIESLAGQLRPVLLVLMGAVVLVLLIACANVGSLQLVRATGRTKEIGVRIALGASRWTIARALLVESLVLSIAGGIAGLALGATLLRALAATDSAQVPALQTVHLDGAVLAFTAGVTVVAALLFGTLPAIRSAGVDPHEALKESARGSSFGRGRHRALQGSVVVQVALTLVLLLGSALTIESLGNLLATDPGFHAEQVMTVRVSASGPRYETGAQRTAFFEQLVERLRGRPGVQSVGIAWGVPFTEGGTTSLFSIPALPQNPNDHERHASMVAVGGDYFRAMGIPLLRGRTFDGTERPRPVRAEGTAPTAADSAFRVSLVIDEALAKKYFPDRDPIGQEIRQGPPGIVVGVVGGVRREELGEVAYPTIYYAQPQFDWIGTYTVVVRSALDPTAITSIVRGAVKEIDPNIPVFDAAPMRERIDRSLGTRRLAMRVLTGFAAVSLLLALLGVYGVISYGVSQRTHEIGIRMALGARPGDVVRMVLAGGLALTVIGAAAGTLLFLGLGRFAASLVYGVGARDPLIIAGGVALLAAIATAACWWPARRAAAISPVEALRSE
jgi:putative ABC transport system permease protein